MTPLAPTRRAAVLAIIVASYLMVVIDISIVLTGLPKIQAGLHFSPTGLSWVQNAYTLVFGGLLLLGARAGDIFERRKMFIAGLALFSIASLAIGLAQSPAWLQVPEELACHLARTFNASTVMLALCLVLVIALLARPRTQGSTAAA